MSAEYSEGSKGTRNNMKNKIAHLLLSIQMIADDMTDAGWDFVLNTANDLPCFNSYAVYVGQRDLYADVLYILPDDCGDFPIDRYPYITSSDKKGAAPHIRLLNKCNAETLNFVIDVFKRYRAFENQLYAVILDNGSLTELLEVAIDFLKNPMYVVDNMFCILSLPQYASGMREFEYDKKTGKSYIPLWLINEFKFDDEFQTTLSTRSAKIWSNDQFPRNCRCMYVNVWDGTYYAGRLLIEELWKSFQPGDFTVAEFVAEFIRHIMIRDAQSDEGQANSFERLFQTLISGDGVKQEDLSNFMYAMSWNTEDSYVGLKTESQESVSVRSDNSLRSRLSEYIKEFFSFLDEDSKKEINELFTKLTDLYIELVDCCIEAYHPDMFLWHDDWGHQRGYFFSMETLEEVFVPHVRRLSDYIHSKGMYFELHSCGLNEQNVPSMINAGVDMWIPQPMNNYFELAKKYHDKIMIGVDMPTYVEDTPDEEVERLAEKFFEDYKDLRIYINDRRQPDMRFSQTIYRLSREYYKDK